MIQDSKLEAIMFYLYDPALEVRHCHFHIILVVPRTNYNSLWGRGLQKGVDIKALLEGGHHNLPFRDYIPQHPFHLGSHVLCFHQ